MPAGVLAGPVLLFLLRVIGALVNTISGGISLADTELAVNVEDFLTTPAWVIGGTLLRQRKALGCATGLGLLSQGSMLFIALIAFLILQPILTSAPSVITDVTVIFLMRLICFTPFTLFMRRVGKPERLDITFLNQRCTNVGA